jgi:hypothetical protein
MDDSAQAKQRADEANRRRSAALRTAHVFVFALKAD